MKSALNTKRLGTDTGDCKRNMKCIIVKLKTVIKNILFLFSKKKVKLENDSISKVKVSKSALSVFSLSTNPIISFRVDGKLFFFRECHKTYKKHEFFENAIVRFFDFIELQKVDKEIFKEKIPIKTSFSEEEIIGFKEYILAKKDERSFYKRIVKTDIISDKSGFNIWITRSYNKDFFSEYGLDDLTPKFFDIAILFLWHMRSSCLLFRTRKISTYDGYSFFSAGKTISSKIVAEELGLSQMIVDAKPTYLVLDDNVQLFGVLTPKAQGCRARDMQISASSLLQKELHNLYLLDEICFQTDHGPDNYNIYCDDEACRVIAFDNDNPYTFSPLPYIKSTIGGCSARKGGKGGMLCPIIGNEIFERIKSISFEVLKKRLTPYLNRVQVYSLICRLRSIQKAMLKAQEEGYLTVLNSNDWNEEMLQMELNGEFGETYLTILMKAIGE